MIFTWYLILSLFLIFSWKSEQDKEESEHSASEDSNSGTALKNNSLKNYSLTFQNNNKGDLSNGLAKISGHEIRAK